MLANESVVTRLKISLTRAAAERPFWRRRPAPIDEQLLPDLPKEKANALTKT